MYLGGGCGVGGLSISPHIEKNTYIIVSHQICVFCASVMANNVLRTQGSGADLMLHPGPKTIYKQNDFDWSVENRKILSLNWPN